MAGVPPLAGFFTKIFILSSVINQSFYIIVLIILIVSTLSSFYYLNFIKFILFEKKKILNLFVFNIEKSYFMLGIILFSSFILIFFIILFPSYIGILIKISSSCLFNFSNLIL